MGIAFLTEPPKYFQRVSRFKRYYTLLRSFGATHDVMGDTLLPGLTSYEVERQTSNTTQFVHAWDTDNASLLRRVVLLWRFERPKEQ